MFHLRDSGLRYSFRNSRFEMNVGLMLIYLQDMKRDLILESYEVDSYSFVNKDHIVYPNFAKVVFKDNHIGSILYAAEGTNVAMSEVYYQRNTVPIHGGPSILAFERGHFLFT